MEARCGLPLASYSSSPLPPHPPPSLFNKRDILFKVVAIVQCLSLQAPGSSRCKSDSFTATESKKEHQFSKTRNESNWIQWSTFTFFWSNMIKYRNLVELQKFYPEEHWKMGENLSFIVIYLPDKRQNECPATSRIFSLARWTMPGHRRARSRPCYVEWFSGNRVYLVPLVLQNLAWVALKGLLDFSRDQLLSRKI